MNSAIRSEECTVIYEALYCYQSSSLASRTYNWRGNGTQGCCFMRCQGTPTLILTSDSWKDKNGGERWEREACIWNKFPSSLQSQWCWIWGQFFTLVAGLFQVFLTAGGSSDWRMETPPSFTSKRQSQTLMLNVNMKMGSFVTDVIIPDLQVLPHRLSLFLSLQVKFPLIVAPSHSVHFNIQLFCMETSCQLEVDSFSIMYGATLQLEVLATGLHWFLCAFTQTNGV